MAAVVLASPIQRQRLWLRSLLVANRFRGGDHDLRMSNGATEVFVVVLMFAVSALARRSWDFRFAAFVAAQDQNIRGRGCVGFRMEDIDWGATRASQAENRSFVLQTVDLALSRYRWDELGYDPPLVGDHLRRFRAIVEAFDPLTAVPEQGAFPEAGDVVAAFCPQHRVLSPLPWYEACVLCTVDQPI